MPRKPRYAPTGALFHVYARGVARMAIFLSDADREKFCLLLERIRAEGGAQFHAWALMTNHFHLLVRPVGTLASVLRSILIPYSRWFNLRQGRVGHVFQGRYGSVPCLDRRHALIALRYVHANPLAAGICRQAEEYRWSGHREILGRSRRTIVAVEETLRWFHTDREAALRKYERSLRVGVDECQKRLASEMLVPFEFEPPGPGPLPPPVPVPSMARLQGLALRIESRYSLSGDALCGPGKEHHLARIRAELCRQAIHEGVATIGDLSRFLHRTPSTLSHLIARHPAGTA